MAKFVVLYNNQPLKTYELDEPVVTVGRLPENTISIANMGVSRRHVRIEEDADRKLVLTDLNSLNGTYVNGKRVKKVPLNGGDKISIGKYTIIYEEGGQGSGVPEYANSSERQLPGGVPVTLDQTINEHQGLPGDVTPPQSIKKPEQSEDNGAHPVLIETNKHVVYKLDKSYVTIGNSETDDIFVSGFMIGKGQVSIERQDDGVYINAQKLMAKFKVNGRATKQHLLKHKDRIEIGASTFRYMENG